MIVILRKHSKFGKQFLKAKNLIYHPILQLYQEVILPAWNDKNKSGDLESITGNTGLTRQDIMQKQLSSLWTIYR